MEAWSSTPSRQQQRGRQPWPKSQQPPSKGFRGISTGEPSCESDGDRIDTDPPDNDEAGAPLLAPGPSTRGGEDEDERDRVPSCGCAVVGSALHALWTVAAAPAHWLFVGPQVTSPVTHLPSASMALKGPTSPCRDDVSATRMGGEAREPPAGSETPPRPPLPIPSAVDYESSPHYKQFHPGDGYEALSPPPSLRNTSMALGTAAAAPSVGSSSYPVVVVPEAGPVPTELSPPTVTRGPIFTVLELRNRIEAVQQWLPIQVKVDGAAVPASASSTPLRRHLKGGGTAVSTQSTPAFLRDGASLSNPADPSMSVTTSLCITLSGPIRRPLERASSWRRALESGLGVQDWDPPSLSDIEDLLLEDTVDMVITGLQLHDVDLTRTTFLGRSDDNRSPGAPLLDFKTSHRAPPSMEGDEEDGGDDAEDEPYEVVLARVLGMAQNLMSQMSECYLRRRESFGFASSAAVVHGGLGHRLHLVRCVCSPNDLLDALRLPDHLEALAFQQCPLADAHIHALLRRARQSDGFFEVLRCLKISGNVSPDAVRSILRYFDEEVEHPVLSELVVPSNCVTVAVGHPIGIRLPSLLVNGRSAAELRAH